MEKNKTKERFKFILISIIVFFTFIYASGMSGYYQTHLQKSTALTKEAILEFEKDIAEGKPVDIKDYIKGERMDYRNQYSRLGHNLSRGIDKILTDGVNRLTKLFKALFS